MSGQDRMLRKKVEIDIHIILLIGHLEKKDGMRDTDVPCSTGGSVDIVVVIVVFE